MKIPTLKYLASVWRAISLLPFFAVVNCYCQNIDGVTYNLMSDIIYSDTLISETKYQILESKVRRKVITKEDSLAYVLSIKNSKLTLFQKTENKEALRILKTDFLNKGKLFQYFSPAEIEHIMKIIPREEYTFQKERLHSSRIALIDYKKMFLLFHKFSSPIKIDSNRFLIYHFKNISKLNHKSEFLIYNINSENKYTIEDNIVLSDH